MWGKSSIGKYLIISIIILAVGIPTAYAITITLGADPIIVLGILDMMSNRIINLGTPTVSTDGATKGYVDSAVSTGTSGLQSQIDSNDVELADHETRITDLENKPITITKLARGSNYVDENFERGIKFIDLHSSVAGALNVLNNTGVKIAAFDVIFRDVGQAQTMISYKIQVVDGDSDFQKFSEPHDIQTVLYIDGNPTTMQCLIPFGQNECIATGNTSIQSDQGWSIGYFVTDDLVLDPNGPILDGPLIFASYTVEIPQ